MRIGLGEVDNVEETEIEDKNVLSNIWNSLKSFQSFLNSLSK